MVDRPFKVSLSLSLSGAGAAAAAAARTVVHRHPAYHLGKERERGTDSGAVSVFYLFFRSLPPNHNSQAKFQLHLYVLFLELALKAKALIMSPFFKLCLF